MRNIPGPDVLTIVTSLSPPEPIAYFDMHTGVIYTLPEDPPAMDCLVSYDYAVQVSADVPIGMSVEERCGIYLPLDIDVSLK